MTHSKTVNALTFELITSLYSLAACMKERKRLYDYGQAQEADALQPYTSATVSRVMNLTDLIEATALQEGRASFGQSVRSLLGDLPENLGESSRVELQSVEEALGITTGATLTTLRREVHIDSSQSGGLEALSRIAFVAGVATIAAAGLGAPLAALATNQAISQRILEEAIVTFSSVTIAEGAIEWKRYLGQRPQSADQSPPSRGTFVPPLDPSELKSNSTRTRHHATTSTGDGFVPPPDPSELKSRSVRHRPDSTTSPEGEILPPPDLSPADDVPPPDIGIRGGNLTVSQASPLSPEVDDLLDQFGTAVNIQHNSGGAVNPEPPSSSDRGGPDDISGPHNAFPGR